MITFKEFLVEASSGKAKWEKYFADGEVETIAKSEADLYDIFEKPVKKKVKKGDKITVLASDEYKPKLRVRIGDGEYLMKLTDIDKPFKVDRKVGIDLKPDKLGIFGPTTIAEYSAKVKRLIDEHDEIPEPVGEYLKALIDLAYHPSDASAAAKVKDLYVTSGIKDDVALKNTINNDYMEVLGPFFVINEKPEYKAGGVKFPELGNEPLYDFTMKKARGPDVVPDQFSSKRSGGNTNTLKVTEVTKAADANPTLKKKYPKEYELLRIIQDNSVKAAPDKINAWLANNFSDYTKAPDTTDNTSIARLEAAVAKYINGSDLDFTELVQNAVPDLWYVKAKLLSDGTLKAEPLKSGREIGTVRLRSKSSPGHLTDKLGFAM